MPTEKKEQILDSLEQAFTQNESGIMADYRGTNTPNIVGLRRKFRENGVEFRIVKNSLAKIAAEKSGKDKIVSIFEGPLAIAFIKDDISVSAKIMTDYITANKLALNIKGGFMGNQLLTAKEVATLATLPPKNILIAKVMGGIQGPLYGLLNQVSAPLRGLAYVLQGRIKQLEGAE